MDYEKKYKESLALMVDCIPDKDGYVHVRPQDIFSELKESKDEMIRRQIINYLKQRIKMSPSIPAAIGSWIAWLEKQGESYTKRDVDDAYVEGMAFAKDELEKQGGPSIKWNKNTEGNKPQVNHSVLMKTTHGITEGEWQGEQWHQYRWAGIVRDSDVLSWIEFSDLDKQGEQKSAAWSEKDDYNVQCMIAKVVSDIQKGNVGRNNELIDWLKSLKQRIGG